MKCYLGALSRETFAFYLSEIEHEIRDDLMALEPEAYLH